MGMERKDYTLDDIAEALGYLNESDRETWVRMGMAVKAEFGDAGRDVWKDWSSRYAKFKEAEANAVWKSFRAGGISLGTLIHAAREAGWQPRQMTDAEQERLRDEVAKRRAKAAEQAQREAEHDAKLEAAVAELSRKIFTEHNVKPFGRSSYLARKKVQAFGIGFPRYAMFAEVNTDSCETVLGIGNSECGPLLAEANERDKETDPRSFRYLSGDVVLVPLRDINGTIHNLQIVYKTGKKSFFKGGRKAGLMHGIGFDLAGEHVPETLLVAEGYSTGASLHMATGYPVVVAIDCGNLRTVGQLLAQKYHNTLFVFCADNDAETDGNPGVTKARQAAAEIGGVCVVPEFGEAA